MKKAIEDGRWPPKKCEMPDLSGVNAKLSLTLLLNRGLAGGGPKNPKSLALAVNFVRLVDKMVVEYERTRTQLLEYINSPITHMSPLLVATGACETLISTMIRAINLARKIRGDQFGPPVERKVPILSNDAWSRVNDMRNDIEHVDGSVATMSWAENDPLFLVLQTDRIELYGDEITYSELAEWVRELHKIASDVANYKEPDPAAPAALKP